MSKADYFKDLDLFGVKKLTNQPSVILSSIRKYSVNNTLPMATLIATLVAGTTFFVQPVVVSVFGFVFMPTPLVFIPLAIFLFTLAMKAINTKRIKEGEINEKIETYKGDEQYSKIAKEAEKIEIITNLGRKEKELSIILPIFKTQRETLEDIEAENRNKVILFTVSYLFSAIIVASALVQSAFASPVLLVMLVAIALFAFVTLNKLRSNNINHENKTIRRFSVLDILLPFRSGTIVLVMEKQAKDQEKNDPLTNFTDEFVNLFGSKLDKACDLLDSFLKTTNGDIKEGLGKILIILNNAEEFTEKVNSLDIKGTFSKVQNSIKTFDDAIKTLKAKVEGIRQGGLLGFFTGNVISNQNGNESGNNQTEGDGNEFLGMLKKSREEVDGLKKSFKELKKSLKAAKDEQNQPSERDSGIGSENGDVPPMEEASQISFLELLKNQEKELKEGVEILKRQENIKKLQEEKNKLQKKSSEQAKINEWEEKLNGEASEFLYYLLESIKLKRKDADGMETEATSRDYCYTTVIYNTNGSMEEIPIKKKEGLEVEPIEAFFVNPNIQAAWERARG